MHAFIVLYFFNTKPKKKTQKNHKKHTKNKHVFAVKIGVTKLDDATCLYWQES